MTGTGSLEDRLARLEAVEAIRNLKSAYHTLINATEFDRVAELFTEDAYAYLGYLTPDGKPWEGREAIRAAFESMKTSDAQSQVKQFLHNHVVEIVEADAARGTALLIAFYGTGDRSFFVTGEYVETYARVDDRWLIARMELKLYFTVPLAVGWAGHKRHYLVNSGETIPDYDTLVPNPPI